MSTSSGIRKLNSVDRSNSRTFAEPCSGRKTFNISHNSLVSDDKRHQMVIAGAKTTNSSSAGCIASPAPSGLNGQLSKPSDVADGKAVNGSVSVQELKKSLTLNFASPDSLKKSLTTPEVLSMFRFTSPNLEKLLLNQQAAAGKLGGAGSQQLNTPTPTQFFYPTNVTNEQEQYARGFIDALNQLHALRGSCVPAAALLSPGFIKSTIEQHLESPVGEKQLFPQVYENGASSSFEQFLKNLSSAPVRMPTTAHFVAPRPTTAITVAPLAVSVPPPTATLPAITALSNQLSSVIYSLSQSASTLAAGDSPSSLPVMMPSAGRLDTADGDLPVKNNVKLECESLVGDGLTPPPPAAAHYVTLTTSVDSPKRPAPSEMETYTNSAKRAAPIVRLAAPNTSGLLRPEPRLVRTAFDSPCVVQPISRSFVGVVTSAKQEGGVPAHSAATRRPIRKFYAVSGDPVADTVTSGAETLADSGANIHRGGVSNDGLPVMDAVGGRLAAAKSILDVVEPATVEVSSFPAYADAYDADGDGRSSTASSERSTTATPGSSPGLPYVGAPIVPAQQERLKLERKRARNRAAATKCRRRKLEIIAKLGQTVRDMAGKKEALLKQVEQCKSHIEDIRRRIEAHRLCGCKV